MACELQLSTLFADTTVLLSLALGLLHTCVTFQDEGGRVGRGDSGGEGAAFCQVGSTHNVEETSRGNLQAV